MGKELNWVLEGGN